MINLQIKNISTIIIQYSNINPRQIVSLLSAVGKYYGRVLIDRIRSRTDGVLEEEQFTFRSGRGCVDQFFCG